MMYGPLKPAFETELLSATKARFWHIEVLQKMFNVVKDTAAELGPWCADLYLVSALAESNLRKYEARVEKKFHANSVGKLISDLDNEIAEVRRASEYVTVRWNMREDNDDDLSDKSPHARSLPITRVSTAFDLQMPHFCQRETLCSAAV